MNAMINGVGYHWRTRLLAAAAIAVTATTGLNVLQPAPAHAASTAGGQISRAEVLQRAHDWYTRNPQLTYDEGGPDDVWDIGHTDTYRRDCSGFVDMAWHLSQGSDLDTWDLPNVSTELLSTSDLLPGDILDDDYGTEHHVVLFASWSADHVNFSYYSFGSTPVKYETTDFSQSDHIAGYSLNHYVPYRYNKIVDAVGTASVYGVKADGTLTYSTIDAATGDFGTVVTSTAALPFTPVALATLNFNTLLITATDGHLYRIDIGTNRTSLTFHTPVDLGAGWGSFNLLTYDGNGHLYGIIDNTGSATLRRYNIANVGNGGPNTADITNYATIDTGFALNTLTATGPDWLLGTTSTGILRSYHISGPGTWTGYTLDNSGWGSATKLLSPGDGIYYYVNNAGAMYHYWDANPYDGNGSDIQYYTNDPVSTTGWVQTLLSAQPDSLS